MKNRVLCVAFLSLAACGEKSEPKSTVQKVHGFLEASAQLRGTKALGESCTENGRSICRSGLCIHADPDPAKGWFCATKCGSDKECPDEWRCGAIYPGFTTCNPPKAWVAKAVSVRGAVTP